MRNLKELSVGSTLIAPAYLHPVLREQIMAKSHGCIGIRIYTLSSWLQKKENKPKFSMVQVIFEYKKMMQEIVSTLSTYREIALSSTFLSECFQLIEELKTYQVDPSTLPRTTTSQKELYEIIKLLYPLKTAADYKQEALEKIKHGETLEMLHIYDYFQTYEEKQIVNLLVEKGATLLTFPYKYPQKAFYHATNMRQEIEACAQHILEHEQDAQDIYITLANPAYKPVIQQVFARYKIPYTLLNDAHSSIFTKRFSALFNYYLRPTNENLFRCIDAQIFQIPGLAKLNDYMQIFNFPIEEPFQHLSTLPNDSHILDKHELERLQDLEEKSEEVRLLLLPVLTRIKHPDDYTALFTAITNDVQASISTYSLEYQSILTQVQDLLKEALPYINTDQDIEFFLPFIEKIKHSLSITQLQGVIISDLCEPYLDKKYQYLLGCTQKSYPAFTSKKGIFDEAYFEKLVYPSMEMRYEFYLAQCKKVLQSSDYLYASYPLGTFEGKAMESALEIEEFINERSITYPLHTNYEPITTTYSITPELAQKLYVKDGEIHGSISSLERYVKCPLSYFLRYGLSLREPMEHGFSASYMGTLSHHVLEMLVEQNGKEYAKSAEELIESILTTEIKTIQYVFPSQSALLENIKQRMYNAITQTLLLLDNFEQHSHMIPSKSEYSFTYLIELSESIKLSLHGFIDRIDESKNYTCIFDYKSSSRTLSEANVFAALQLQLLTYSIVAKQDLKKDVMGAYYISLKNENIPYIAGKMSRRKPITHIPYTKADYTDIRHKAHRFNGWTMQKEIELLDDNATHFVGITQSKEGFIKSRKLYDLDMITLYFKQMYKMIGTRILDGDIGCTPTEDACMFCDYYEICRFKGIYAERKLLIEYDEQLYQKEDETDA